MARTVRVSPQARQAAMQESVRRSGFQIRLTPNAARRLAGHTVTFQSKPSATQITDSQRTKTKPTSG